MLTRTRAAINPYSQWSLFRCAISSLKEPKEEMLMIAYVCIASVASYTLDCLADAERDFLVTDLDTCEALLVCEIARCRRKVGQTRRYPNHKG